MRHVVILNPAAGKRDATARLAAEAKAAFEASGAPYKLEFTGAPGDAERIARRAVCEGGEVTIYACGGDGTIAETAQALYNAPNATLAPVPVGTGNDFVRTITGGDRQERYSLSELIASGETVSADYLLAGGRVAMNIVSVGLDAAIANNVSRFKRIPLVSGAAAYKLSTAFCFFTKVNYRMRFEIDRKELPEGDFVFAIAANGRYYGGGFNAAPLADIQDGMIDFIRIPTLPRIRLLPMISSYRKGEHLEKYSFLELIRCKKLKIISDGPVDLNCDGEIKPAVDPTIEVVPGGIKLLVPSRYALAASAAKNQAALQK